MSDTYIQKAKKRAMDSKSRVHLTPLNAELRDVQRIMVQNIDDVLQRGAAISGDLFNFQNNENDTHDHYSL